MAATITALGAGGTAAVGAPPITKTELRRDAPALTARRLKDLLWEMFDPEDRRSKTPPRAMLARLWLQTKPFATEVPKLCRYDSVRVEMVPAAPGPRDSDTPVRPAGLDVTHLFRFLAPPPLDEGWEPRARSFALPSAGGPCAGLETEDREGFFEAEDEETARDGMIAFLKLQRAIREKRPFALACDLGYGEQRPCAEVLEQVDPHSLASIRACEAKEGACFAAIADPGEIRIVIARDGPQTSGEVISATAVAQVVLAHTLID